MGLWVPYTLRIGHNRSFVRQWNAMNIPICCWANCHVGLKWKLCGFCCWLRGFGSLMILKCGFVWKSGIAPKLLFGKQQSIGSWYIFRPNHMYVYIYIYICIQSYTIIILDELRSWFSHGVPTCLYVCVQNRCLSPNMSMYEDMLRFPGTFMQIR